MHDHVACIVLSTTRAEYLFVLFSQLRHVVHFKTTFFFQAGEIVLPVKALVPQKNLKISYRGLMCEIGRRLEQMMIARKIGLANKDTKARRKL